MSIYINPDFKPTRRHFYIIIIAWLVLSVMLILDHDMDHEFGIGVFASAVLSLFLGAVIIHADNFRDRVFGLSICPLCKKRTISIKDKLKAKTHGKSDAKCKSCNRFIALPWVYVVHCMGLMALPIVALLLFESIKLMFIVAWLVGISYLVYFGRFLHVVRQKK